MSQTESIRINTEDKKYITEQAKKNGRTLKGELHHIVEQERKRRNNHKR